MWCWMEAVTINKCAFPNTWAWGVTRTTFGTVLTPVRGGNGKREIEGTLPTHAGSWNSYSQVDGESFRHIIYCLIPTPVGGACAMCTCVPLSTGKSLRTVAPSCGIVSDPRREEPGAVGQPSSAIHKAWVASLHGVQVNWHHWVSPAQGSSF